MELRLCWPPNRPSLVQFEILILYGFKHFHIRPSKKFDASYGHLSECPIPGTKSGLFPCKFQKQWLPVIWWHWQTELALFRFGIRISLQANSTQFLFFDFRFWLFRRTFFFYRHFVGNCFGNVLICRRLFNAFQNNDIVFSRKISKIIFRRPNILARFECRLKFRQIEFVSQSQLFSSDFNWKLKSRLRVLKRQNGMLLTWFGRFFYKFYSAPY